MFQTKKNSLLVKNEKIEQNVMFCLKLQVTVIKFNTHMVLNISSFFSVRGRKFNDHSKTIDSHF